MKKLIITVEQIKGSCPVYKLGDKIILDEGYKLNLKETSAALCLHSIASILPYYNAIYYGVSPKKLGLSIKEYRRNKQKPATNKKAYLQCLDPCELTGGGTVIFSIEVKR